MEEWLKVKALSAGPSSLAHTHTNTHTHTHTHTHTQTCFDDFVIGTSKLLSLKNHRLVTWAHELAEIKIKARHPGLHFESVSFALGHSLFKSLYNHLGL
jgi:hypothetical protein